MGDAPHPPRPRSIFGCCRHFLHGARSNTRGSAREYGALHDRQALMSLTAVLTSTAKGAVAHNSRCRDARRAQLPHKARASMNSRCIRNGVVDVPGLRKVHLAESPQSLQAFSMADGNETNLVAADCRNALNRANATCETDGASAMYSHQVLAPRPLREQRCTQRPTVVGAGYRTSWRSPVAVTTRTASFSSRLVRTPIHANMACSR